MRVTLTYEQLRKIRNDLADHQAIRDLILMQLETRPEESLTGTEIWIKGMLTDLVTGEERNAA